MGSEEPIDGRSGGLALLQLRRLHQQMPPRRPPRPGHGSDPYRIHQAVCVSAIHGQPCFQSEGVAVAAGPADPHTLRDRRVAVAEWCRLSLGICVPVPAIQAGSAFLHGERPGAGGFRCRSDPVFGRAASFRGERRDPSGLGTRLGRDTHTSPVFSVQYGERALLGPLAGVFRVRRTRHHGHRCRNRDDDRGDAHASGNPQSAQDFCQRVRAGGLSRVRDSHRWPDPGPEARSSGTYFDWFFLLVLAAAVFTGILSEVLRLAQYQTWMYAIYFFHLTLILALFLYAPYSKFAHFVYRTVALAATWEGEKQPTATQDSVRTDTLADNSA